jgi:radical SAM superfamily enzyme YgiQ (UPF0313 family)
MRETGCDYILKGEYDLLLGDTLEVVAGGTNSNITSGNLLELGALQQSDEALWCPQPPDRNLDNEPLPAYDLIDFNSYFGDEYVNNRLKRKARWAVVLASRGCSHQCSFCFNFFGPLVRLRSVDSVVDELEYLQREHNVFDVFFIDFHFTANQAWVVDFCDAMRRRAVKVRWSAQVRCDTVSSELLNIMGKSGCHSLWFGVESLDSSLISRVGKYQDSDVAIHALTNCTAAGIAPHQFIMIGLPGESIATLNRTITQMHAMKVPYTESVLIATPRYGTKYYALAKKQFPGLGDDFKTLAAIRGIVANELTPWDLQRAMLIFQDRSFLYKGQVPILT